MAYFGELMQDAELVREEYTALQQETGQRPWGAAEYAQGFVADVGDLMKLIMAREGFRSADEIGVRLAHELCDCLWSVLILAQELDINLEQEFPRQMEALLQKVRAKRALAG